MINQAFNDNSAAGSPLDISQAEELADELTRLSRKTITVKDK